MPLHLDISLQKLMLYYNVVRPMSTVKNKLNIIILVRPIWHQVNISLRQNCETNVNVIFSKLVNHDSQILLNSKVKIWWNIFAKTLNQNQESWVGMAAIIRNCARSARKFLDYWRGHSKFTCSREVGEGHPKFICSRGLERGTQNLHAQAGWRGHPNKA